MPTAYFMVEGQQLIVESCARDGKMHNATAFIATDRSLTFRTADGRLKSSRITKGGAYGTRWTSHADLIREVMQLGGLPRKQGLIKRLLTLATEKREREHVGYAASELMKTAVNAGIPLTQRQLTEARRLARHRA